VNEKQIVAMVVGFLGVLATLLAWASFYGETYTETAQGVAGAIIFIIVFAVIAGGLYTASRR